VDFLTSEDGRKFLISKEGMNFLITRPGSRFLKSKEGNHFIISYEGNYYMYLNIIFFDSFLTLKQKNIISNRYLIYNNNINKFRLDF
jgi:hypothetical protein